MREENATHSMLIGYVLWIFGFIGAHRFLFRQASNRRYLVSDLRAVLYWLDHRSAPDTLDGAAGRHTI